MSQLPKNKSILIDSSEHQKVKQLADRFNITVKQYVEDMIDYGFKTGFNPTVMKRDRIMEKLNQIQEGLVSPKTSDKNENMKMQNQLHEMDCKISEVLKNSSEILINLSGTYRDRINKIQGEKEAIINLSKELLMAQKNFKESVLARNPRFMEGITGVIPDHLAKNITKVIETFDQIDIKYKKLI